MEFHLVARHRLQLLLIAIPGAAASAYVKMLSALSTYKHVGEAKKLSMHALKKMQPIGFDNLYHTYSISKDGTCGHDVLGWSTQNQVKVLKVV